MSDKTKLDDVLGVSPNEDKSSEKTDSTKSSSNKESKAKETKEQSSAAAKSAKKEEVKQQKEPKEEKQVIEDNKKSEKKELQCSEQKSDDTKSIVGSKIKLSRPTAIYRGPSMDLLSKSFGGTVTVTGDWTDNGFLPVEFVRSGFGLTHGYIRLSKEAMEKCHY